MPSRRRPTPEPKPVDPARMSLEELEAVYEASRDPNTGRRSMTRAAEALGIGGRKPGAVFANMLANARHRATQYGPEKGTRSGPTIQEIVREEWERAGSWEALAETTAETRGGKPRLSDNALQKLYASGPGRIEFSTVQILADSWHRWSELDLLLAFARGARTGALDVDTVGENRLAMRLTRRELDGMTDADLDFLVTTLRAYLSSKRQDRPE